MVSLRQLTTELHSFDVALRRRAAEQLAHDPDQARALAAALVERCADADETVRQLVSSALEDLGTPADDQLAALLPLVEHPHADVAYWAATLIGRFGQAGQAGVPALAQALASHPAVAVRERAVWALGQIGPASADARPALLAASRAREPRLARLARAALERLPPLSELG